MSKIANRPNSALLIVDVQNGVVSNAHNRQAVIANIRLLIEKARLEQVPVIWVQHADEQMHKGSDSWQIVPDLNPAEEEHRIEKNFGDSFEETPLESVLSRLGVGRLFIAGAQTDACIRSTIHGAFVRGYDAILVSDAHTTEDLSAWGAPPPEQVIVHTNLYWAQQTAPGRIAGVSKTQEVCFDRGSATASP